MPELEKTDATGAPQVEVGSGHSTATSQEHVRKPWHRRAVDEAQWLFTTREGLVGDYDYMFMLTPDIPPFNRRYKDRPLPFFGIDERIPLLLTLLLGIQHALAMIGGVVAPPLLVAGAAGANLSAHDQAYLVSASLILAGIFSCFQIIRFPIFRTGLFIGTGMLSVVGESFAIVPVATNYFAQQYASGKCLTGSDGLKLPCPAAYGRFLGTIAVTMLFQVLLSLVKPRILMRIFPKLVSGMVLLCIGAGLTANGMQAWAGGSGPCMSRPTSGQFVACPNISAPKPKPWGDPAFLGLGFSVYASILLVEIFGSPILRNCSVAVGLVIGSIIASTTGYIDNSSITAAPRATFLWTTTFPLGVDGALVLPLLAACIITLVSNLGDIVATAEVSGLDIDLDDEDANNSTDVQERVQGGLLADSMWSVLAPLATTTPTVAFAQNNGVIALTNCASRRAGYACALFLFIAGVACRFGASIVALPSSVIGGMTTFLFTSIVVSGLRILAAVPWNRRNRFIATAALALGMSDLVVPDWALYLFSESGNDGVRGLKDGVGLMIRTSYCIVAFVGVLLNVVVPAEKGRGSGRRGAAGEVGREVLPTRRGREE